MKPGTQKTEPIIARLRRKTALPTSMRGRRGFTLIELMITVAIVGILAAIAYPSYQEQVRKSRRGQVKADLTELAQFMERSFTNNNRYRTAGPDGILGNADDGPVLPFTRSPRTAVLGTQFYNIVFTAFSANNFTLSATAVNAQAGDRCGTYTLNQAGTKTPPTPPATTPADCW